MSRNPLNLLLRFLLELAALASDAYWGYAVHTGVARWVLAAVLPLAAATLWGVFRVPNDPNKPPVAVSGRLRLALEFAVFATAVAAAFGAISATAALAFGLVVLAHYGISYDRTLTLARNELLPPFAKNQGIG
ncbi:MAG TPA: DUF2568 domain-containing protein [Candidatus Kapabacteria bacterium]|nr:DUF2568 domain-containing protein [Candidatus Kapabacteria bacterium]